MSYLTDPVALNLVHPETLSQLSRIPNGVGFESHAVVSVTVFDINIITVVSHGGHGISNNRQLLYLMKTCSGWQLRKHQRSRLLSLCEGNSPVAVTTSNRCRKFFHAMTPSSSYLSRIKSVTLLLLHVFLLFLIVFGMASEEDWKMLFEVYMGLNTNTITWLYSYSRFLSFSCRYVGFLEFFGQFSGTVVVHILSNCVEWTPLVSTHFINILFARSISMNAKIMGNKVLSKGVDEDNHFVLFNVSLFAWLCLDMTASFWVKELLASNLVLYTEWWPRRTFIVS